MGAQLQGPWPGDIGDAWRRGIEVCGAGLPPAPPREGIPGAAAPHHWACSGTGCTWGWAGASHVAINTSLVIPDAVLEATPGHGNAPLRASGQEAS